MDHALIAIVRLPWVKKIHLCPLRVKISTPTFCYFLYCELHMEQKSPNMLILERLRHPKIRVKRSVFIFFRRRFTFLQTWGYILDGILNSQWQNILYLTFNICLSVYFMNFLDPESLSSLRNGNLLHIWSNFLSTLHRASSQFTKDKLKYTKQT